MAKSTPGNSALFLQYLESIEPSFHPVLIQLHSFISALVPDATEVISYQVLCFKQTRMLVGLGANKKSASLYTMSSKLLKSMKDIPGNIKVSGMTLHFAAAEKVPAAFIEKIVKARLAENAALDQQKK